MKRFLNELGLFARSVSSMSSIAYPIPHIAYTPRLGFHRIIYFIFVHRTDRLRYDTSDW